MSFTFSKKKRERLLARIDKHNSSLDELLHISTRQAPSKRPRDHGAAKALTMMRDGAISLYRALCSCWPCACHAHSHTTHLLLEQRPTEVSNHTRDERFVIHFATTFEVSEPACWKIACIEARRRPSVTEEAFQKPDAAHLRPACAQPRLHDWDSTEDIVDLCGALCKRNTEREAIGRLAGGDGMVHHLYTITELHESPTKSITLAAMLKNGLSRRCRLILAVICASSLLQLHGTSWLGCSLSKHDVIFLEDKYVSDRFDIRKPFLARQTTPHPHEDKGNARLEGERALSHLGILLLELCFGQALEEQPLWKHRLGSNRQPNRFTDREAAQEWQQSVLGESGEWYSTAVQRCLTCAFGTTSIDLADPELSQAIHDNVVEPLRATLLSHDGMMMKQPYL